MNNIKKMLKAYSKDQKKLNLVLKCTLSIHIKKIEYIQSNGELFNILIV